jgi:hypothetical protein
VDGWLPPAASVTEHDNEDEQSGQGNISRSRLLMAEKEKRNLGDAMFPDKNRLA